MVDYKNRARTGNEVIKLSVPDKEPRKPTEILQKISELIEARGEQHGNYQENLELIAKFWSLYLGIEVTSYQACTMMELLKIARQHSSPKIDDFEDAVGYATLAAALYTNA